MQKLLKSERRGVTFDPQVDSARVGALPSVNRNDAAGLINRIRRGDYITRTQ